MATQNDDPLADLAEVRDELIRIQNRVPELRKRRNELICVAREHGAIGDDLSEAAGVSRQTVHDVLRENHIPAPNRTRSTYQRRVRQDLRHALTAAGIDTLALDAGAELGAAVHRALTETDENED